MVYGKLGLESASEKRSRMSSKETPGASSSRGTAIRLEATAGTGNPSNRIEDVDICIALGQPTAGTGNPSIRNEDVDIALGQPTAGNVKLEFFQGIDDPKGDYKVQVLGCGAAPQHGLPNPPVRDLDSDLYKKIVAEIVDKFYEDRFKQLQDDLDD